MPDEQDGVAVVSVPGGGPGRRLAIGEHVTFGRDPANDFAFPGEPRLSRHAGRFDVDAGGVVVTNTGRTHSLFVRSEDGSAELEPRADGPATAWVLRRGVAFVSVPWPGSTCRLEVVVARGPAGSGPPAATPGIVSTARPVRLDAATKLFATALLLCRPRLEAGSLDVPRTPTVPELTRELLVATDSYHLLAAFDAGDGAVRDRLTARVHDQLRELRAKAVRHRLAPQAVSLSAATLAELLVRHRVLTRDDLALVDDPEWRTRQYDRWWG